ncbi:MAG: membrane dipeptidase [Gemmatimonadaceae bacterium]|nr:membrane dipeptidase [Gemmatimonadaceae bacterium]
MRPYRSLCLAAAVVAAAASPSAGQAPSPEPSAADFARAHRVLRSTPLIDGHNDLPWEIRRQRANPRNVHTYDLNRPTAGHTDLARLDSGRVGAQFWSVYVPGDFADSGYARVQLEQIDIARQVIAKYPRLEFAWSAADVRRAFRRGRIASLIGMEGGHVIENSIALLRTYRDLGARYMTLTHNVTLDWADAASDTERHGGLTAFGEEVVREMNRLGMLVDLSHVSPGAMSDALTVSLAPVIFSHSSARALTDVPRNVPDSILARLPQNGGVVMVTFVPGFISAAIVEWSAASGRERASLRARFGQDTAAIRRGLDQWRTAHPAPRSTLAQVADHIEHVRRVAGIDHVGIGGDFDGIDDTPDGLSSVADYPRLFAELSRRGWREPDLRKLAGENVLRVMERAEVVAARLQRDSPPATARIP